MTEQENQKLEKVYIKNQRKWLKATGVGVGSKVLVATKLPSCTYIGGWGVRWVDEMDASVGHVVTVVEINEGARGIRCRDTDNADYPRCNLPFWVLIKQ